MAVDTDVLGAPAAARSDPHHVVVLLYDGVQVLDVTGPIEALSAANTVGARYAVTHVSLSGGEVLTASGVRLGVDASVDDAPLRIDTLMIAGAPRWQTAISDGELISAVAGLDARSHRTVSICAGTFLLAAAGRLEGRRAVTHWDLARQLAGRFPGVDVDAHALFAADGKYVTSAGVTAAIDMTLALIEHDGTAELARHVARRLLVFMPRPAHHAQLSVRLQTPVSHTAGLRTVVDAINAEPQLEHSLASLAALIGVSPRHLGRLFSAEIGVSPRQYVDLVRLEAACAMLIAGVDGLDAIAARCGIGTGESLRRLFRRELGVTPSAYRSQLNSRGIKQFSPSRIIGTRSLHAAMAPRRADIHNPLDSEGFTDG
ncbi:MULTISPECIES: GlxA family transcriptional regulator [unclassified Mycolicibacterium]|uniref:GlxA family transcriptional regulator n=1 Tax=unclassified Mycolicibacterium TaxID=2636767 RepID=UPI002ED94E18